MWFKFILIALLGSCFFTKALCADLIKHLKTFECPKGVHSMRNIDFIYMINLDQRPEKWSQSICQLIPYGIYPFRFSAVNGWELSLQAINEVGLKFSPEMEGGFMATCYLEGGDYQPSHEIIQTYGKTYFCHCLSRGAIGIALSHISILQNAYDAGFETIWVMEDDILVRRDPRVISELIDRLDALIGRDNWDILFTDKDMRDQNGNYNSCYWAAKRPDFVFGALFNNYGLRRVVSDEFWQIGARWGAHSMIIRRSGINKLLQFFKAHDIFMPYDMDYIFPPGIKLYAVLDDVVTNNPKAVSDNGGPNYLNK